MPNNSTSAMQTTGETQLSYQIYCPGLPLTVYREVAAHLRQVPGVKTVLNAQTSQQFDYNQSQIGSLWIQYAENIGAASRQRVDQILAHYSDRYGSWHSDPPPSNSSELAS
ncbi:MAG: hypothetical protein VKJ46_11260 [Leptolyngbyaceae bacterium]|nr:hypothetical protein [Leptolyngbyaceae bacterium]